MSTLPRTSLFLVLSFCFIFPISAIAGLDDHQVLRGGEAEEKVEGAELVRISYERKVPSFVRFREGQGIPRNYFETWLQKRFRSLKPYEFEKVKEKKDRIGYTHVHYRQLKHGIPVMGGECIAHIKGGKVRSFNGVLFTSLRETPSSPSIGREQARQSALDAIGADLYKWEKEGADQWLKNFTGNPDTSYFPEGELVIAPSSGNIQQDEKRLAYRFNIYAHKPVSRANYYVDARSGEVLFHDDIIKTVDDTGTAVTGYSGSRTIVADSIGPSTYHLTEVGRGNGIETYDMNEGTDYNNAVNFLDSNNYWDNANADLDEYAGDAHWGAERTYDYYWQKHNRNSIDDNGFALLSYVHYDQDYGNAFWDGDRMTYGDGSNGNQPLTALDICGHEITHGLTSQTAALVYQDEPGALNESFSDIFGNSIEYFAKPSNASWQVGEDIGAFRSMSDPNSFGDPDTYQGPNWFTGTSDNGGVHTNSGVQNYWYYLLVEGGSGTNGVGDSYNVTGVGWDTAAAIAYRNLVNYLGTGSEYADARFYAIQSAIDLYGACSQAHESTTDAWYAVNVGDPFSPNVVADFQVSKDSSCTAPVTVEFNPLTSNASNFKWFFGDGDSSTAFNPTHTYSDTGYYDVTLQVSGGCGSDTITVQDKIKIDNSIPCEQSMPVSGSDSIDACTGTLYDNGGPDANYPDQEDSYYTIAPSGADSVTLNFNMFDVEAGSGSNNCDYDYLEIFDGPNSSAPSLGVYCNNTGSPGQITSSGGSITVHLHSDQAVNNPGFELEWTCTKSGNAPKADFEVLEVQPCNGRVRFDGKSYFGSIDNRTWVFGDGDSSSVEDPVHIYDQTGTYTVKLFVSNSNGSDSLIKVDRVQVDPLPLPSPTQGDTICENQQAELYANSGASWEIRWMDAATGGSFVGLGDTLITNSLTTSTDYFAQKITPTEKLGPVDNNFGTGSNFNYDQYLIFDCDTPSQLLSVKVYASGGSNRDIQLRDSSGAVIEDTNIYIPDGEQRVALNFRIPEGQSLQLGVGGQGADLYRNDNGANYPYTLPNNNLSIERSSASSAPYDYYYFFYDWKVQSPACNGPRKKVRATVKACQSIEGQQSELSFQVTPNPSRGRFLLQGSFMEQDEVDLTVTDSYGKRVERIENVSGKRYRLDMSNLAPGMYFLKVRSEKGSKIERLLIQR